jgi:hypothetical protein
MVWDTEIYPVGQLDYLFGKKLPVVIMTVKRSTYSPEFAELGRQVSLLLHDLQYVRGLDLFVTCNVIGLYFRTKLQDIHRPSVGRF